MNERMEDDHAIVWLINGMKRPSNDRFVTIRDDDEEKAMHYFRIYADSDGESHFADGAITLSGQSGGSEYSERYPATGVIFRRSPADQYLDWHPAPRRQFVITLSGEAEVEASDGEVRQIGPGTIMLAEDTTGKGHITRGRGAAERLSVFIPLPD